MQWYERVTWTELITLFRQHDLSIHESKALEKFEIIARKHGALASDRPQKQSAMSTPTSHDYGEVFASIKARDTNRSAVASYGAGISPVLFLGRNDWAQPLASNSVERIALFYNLPNYGSQECYAFQIWLWDDNIFPGTNIQPSAKIKQLTKLAAALDGRWEVGKRRGKGRLTGTTRDSIPADSGTSLVGVVTFESLFIFPPYESTSELVTRLHDQITLLENILNDVLK